MVATHLARLGVIALLVGMIAGCAGTGVSVTRLRPPEVDIPGGEGIAVGPVVGERGAGVQAALQQTLRRSGYVRLVAQGTGTIADYEVEGETRDIRFEVKDDASDKWCRGKNAARDCMMWVTTASAELSVVLRLRDRASGRIVASKTLRAHKRRMTTGNALDEGQRQDLKEELLDECEDKIAEDFVSVLAPTRVRQWLSLEADRELAGITAGNRRARRHDWAGAEAAYAAALLQPDITALQKAKLHYNLGVVAAEAGAFDRSLHHFRASNSSQPNSRATRQMASLQRRRLDVQRLQALGYAHDLPAQKHERRSRTHPAPFPHKPPTVQHLASATELGAIRSVAIPRPTVSGVGDIAETLADVAVVAASKNDQYSVIGASDVNAMLDFETQKDLLNCSEILCMAEIAAALDVDALVVLKVGRIGSVLRVGADLIDARHPRVLSRAHVQTIASDEQVLRIADEVVAAVLGSSGFLPPQEST